MAQIQCKECSKDASLEADKCPHCDTVISTAITCQNCKSIDIKKISNASKVGSTLM